MMQMSYFQHPAVHPQSKHKHPTRQDFIVMLFSARHLATVCTPRQVHYFTFAHKVEVPFPHRELMCLYDVNSLRLPVDPHDTRPLPSVPSKTASFTIRLFQMINYSTVYLHCDLSVCLRNNSECERVSLNRATQTRLADENSGIIYHLERSLNISPQPFSTFHYSSCFDDSVCSF